MTRGLDFLSEIELGNAPPLEYVVNNLAIDETQQPARPFNVEEIIDKVKQKYSYEEQRL